MQTHLDVDKKLWAVIHWFQRRTPQDARISRFGLALFNPKRQADGTITRLHESRHKDLFFQVEERRPKKFKFNLPPPGWRAASLNPSQRTMELCAEGDVNARAIIEAWNPGRSLARHQTVVHVRAERKSVAACPLEGECIPNADLDALLAVWRRTRSQKDYDTLILSARPYLERICRSITHSDDYGDLLHSVQDALTVVMEGPEAINKLRSYLLRTATNLHATMLRKQYLTRKTKDGEPMPKFLPLSAADHLTTDDGDDLDLWRERPASSVDDPAVAIVAQMLQDGLTLDQVSEALGISRNALYRRVNRHLARKHSGVVDLNACADQPHSMQNAGGELHDAQSEADRKIFLEILSTIPDFGDFIVEGEVFPHRFAAL